MKKRVFLSLVLALGAVLQAPAFWPFSSDDDEKEPPRLSELLEPASKLIDEATDLAADGKISEAVAKYREAIAEIGRVEQENADRAATPEFNSLKNKRAYVNAAIDSLLLAESQQNAKPVAISDTTGLQKRYDAIQKAKGEQRQKELEKVAVAKGGQVKKENSVAEVAKPVERASRKVPVTRKEKIAYASEDVKRGDFAAAELMARDLLKEIPNDAAALNLLAVAQIGLNDAKAAEGTLDRAIQSNPRNYYAYYNMARLMLKNGNKDGAKRYYETGRAFGGPKNKVFEEAFK